MLLILAGNQRANPWTDASPDYWRFANIWDARWYHIIAVSGYPSELPLTDDGHVAENAWAFLPVFPAFMRLLMVTGIPWDPLAVMVSLGFGLGSALLFYRLMTRVVARDQAMFAVVLYCVAPVSALFQLGYAEAMQMFFLNLALLLLLDRRYALLFPVVAVMALTRPAGLAFALALALHIVYRFAVRRREPFPARERVLSAGVAVFSGLMGLAWPILAWAVTGLPSAYFDTELAWRSAYIGHVELIPFTAWFQSGSWWLGEPLGWIVVCTVAIGFAAALFSPAVRRLGVDLRFWLASYGLYLFAVFFPQSSTFRLLMPMAPMLGAIALPRNAIYRISVVVVSLVLQWGWLLVCWAVDGRDWTPP